MQQTSVAGEKLHGDFAQTILVAQLLSRKSVLLVRLAQKANS